MKFVHSYFARYHGRKICDERDASNDSWNENC